MGLLNLPAAPKPWEKMKGFQKAFSNFTSHSDHSGEAILKGTDFRPGRSYGLVDQQGLLRQPPSQFNPDHHSKIYRDVFIIWYTGHTYKFDDDLPVKQWPEIYKNSKKLIDERFPPKPLASSPGPEELSGGGAPVYSAGLD